jgi:phenylalanyl-tRNA synthetase beta chain
MICGAFVGNMQENIWATPRKLDFFDVKGTVQYLFEKFQLPFNLELTTEENFIHGKCFNITSNGIRMGIIGEIHSNLLNKFDIKNEEVILFELGLDKFIEHSEHITKPVSYNLFSKYQESTRDLDLIINKSVLSQEILDEIKTIKLIKNVEIFDVFQAKNLPNNKKSLGIRLIISSDSHTLTSEEIQNLEKKALKKLNKRFGAELRG